MGLSFAYAEEREGLKRDAPDEMPQQVRLARQTAGMTQSGLAKKIGISQAKLSLFELGQVALSEAELKRVWRTLEKKLQGKAGLLSDVSGRAKLATPNQDSVDELPKRRLLRQQANLSQHEAAKKIGISQNRLSQWENGQLELSPDEQRRWRRELALADPKIAHQAGQELWKLNQKLQEENTRLRAELFNAEEIAALRYAQIQDLAERLERLQSPLVKDTKE